MSKMPKKIQKRRSSQSGMSTLQQGYPNSERTFKLLTPNAYEIYFTAETHEIAVVAIIALGWGTYGVQKVSNNVVILLPGMNKRISSTRWFKNHFDIDLREFALKNADKIVKTLKSMKRIDRQLNSMKIVNTAKITAEQIESKYT